MILFSVIFKFSMLQIADAVTSEMSIQPVDPWITQLLATQFVCSILYILRQFGLTWCRRVLILPTKLSEVELLVLYFFLLKRKELKSFPALQPFRRLMCFVPKVHMVKIIDRIVWIGELILCLYQKNWTLMIVKT